MPLPAHAVTGRPSKISENPDSWIHQDLSRFKIELPKDDLFAANDEDLTNTSFAVSSGLEEITLEEIEKSHPQPKKAPTSDPKTQSLGGYTGSNLSPIAPSQIEDAIRQEARAAIETITWKILPEIVERVVREELQKLLKDAERL